MNEIPGRLVSLRRATRDDADAFRQILTEPEVAPWWGDPEEQLADVLSPETGITTYAIQHDGATVGVIQSNEELTPQYRHAGIDIAVHPDWHGRGIGADAIYSLAKHLIDQSGHHRSPSIPQPTTRQPFGSMNGSGFEQSVLCANMSAARTAGGTTAC